MPKLPEWLAAGHQLWLRMLRLDSRELLQEWPPELTVEADGAVVFTVAPPEKGHRRRDVPLELTQLLHVGVNQVQLRVSEGQGLVVGLVRAVPKAPRRLCQEVPRQEAAEALERLLTMLRDSQEEAVELESHLEMAV